MARKCLGSNGTLVFYLMIKEGLTLVLWQRRTELSLENGGGVLRLNVILYGSGVEDWYWSLSPNGVFSVKKLTDLLMRADLANSPPAVHTIRNHLVPLKVELFVWRARHNRLPTRVELDKPGIDLGTIRCPICDDGLETVEHSILSCKTAKDIWDKVLKWWDLIPPPSRNLADVFLGQGGPGHSFSHSFSKQLWQATEWITCYMIWRNRNNQTFSKSKLTSDLIFKEIQLKSFEGISNRCKLINLEWDRWVACPLSLMSNAFSRSGIG
ncbi:uncharacterized protein [Rutidosis leptorrhynchoides]|uniref:uncharacterized protein n=1 Tax=Rutidosis leptorrhynchoides TaxID=125765 RepID=UPI003A99E8C7